MCEEARLVIDERHTLRHNFVFTTEPKVEPKVNFCERCWYCLLSYGLAATRLKKTRSLHQYAVECDIRNKGGGGRGQSCSDMAADGKFLGGSAVTGQQKARDKYLQGPLIKTAQRSRRHPAYVPAQGTRRRKAPGFPSEKKSRFKAQKLIARPISERAPRFRNDEPQNERTRSKIWR